MAGPTSVIELLQQLLGGGTQYGRSAPPATPPVPPAPTLAPSLVTPDIAPLPPTPVGLPVPRPNPGITPPVPAGVATTPVAAPVPVEAIASQDLAPGQALEPAGGGYGGGAPPPLPRPNPMASAASGAPEKQGFLDKLRAMIPQGFQDGMSDFGAGLGQIPQGAGAFSSFAQGFSGSVGSRGNRIATVTERTRLDEKEKADQAREDTRWERERDWTELNLASQIEDRTGKRQKLTSKEIIEIDKIVMTELKNLREDSSLPEEQIIAQGRALRKELTERALTGTGGYEGDQADELTGDDDYYKGETEPEPETGEGGAATPPAPAGIEDGSSTKPLVPKSTDDLVKRAESAYKAGATDVFYVNPADGKTYRYKKGAATQ